MDQVNLELQALAKKDFRVFLEIIWPYIKMEPHPIQLKVAHWVQHSSDHALMMAQRGFGKTYLDAAFIDWCLFRNPDIKIMVLSARENRAIEIVRLAKGLLHAVPMLNHLRPGPEDLNGQRRFDVASRTVMDNKDPSVHAYGIGSQITGAHVDVIIADDIEIPDNSATVEAREKLREKVREFEDILNPGGKILMIGTPQSIQSIYFDLYKEGIYEMIRVPAQYPDPEQDDLSMQGLAPWLMDDLDEGRAQPGDPTYPERWPLDKLMEALAKQGASRYALQRQLDPTLSDQTKYPLKLANFLVADIGKDRAPDRLVWGNAVPRRDIPSTGLGKDQFYEPVHISQSWRDYEQSVMYIDPAGMGADEVGWCIGKLLNGTVYIPAAGGLDGGHSDGTLKRLLLHAKEYNVRRIVVEKNYGDGMYGKALAGMAAGLGMKVAIEFRQVSGQKEVRICDTLEPALGAHRICLDSSVAKDKKLTEQITHLSRDRGCLAHDDRVEALEGVVWAFGESLFRDTEQAVADLEEQEWQHEMRSFIKAMDGARASQPKKAPSMFQQRRRRRR